MTLSPKFFRMICTEIFLVLLRDEARAQLRDNVVARKSTAIARRTRDREEIFTRRASSSTGRESLPSRAIEIAPVSSETTITTASVCSVKPSARDGAFRTPFGQALLRKRQETTGGFDRILADDCGAVVQR